MTNSDEKRVGCIIVHHFNYPDVLETVSSIVSSGISAADIVLVDNSESSEIATELELNLPKGVGFKSIPNKGYANAVNVGVSSLTSNRNLSIEFILVATHETRCDSRTISRLVEELSHDPKKGVVAPLLVTPAGTVFSAGGELRGWLGLPYHIGAKSGLETYRTDSLPKNVDWLDGAFCLYRADILKNYLISEDYFLYFEETDYHSRLRRLGWLVSCVPEVRASASSAGIPPYYLGRGSRIYYARNGNAIQAAISPLFLMVKYWLLKLASGSTTSIAGHLLRGYRDGGITLRSSRKQIE